MFRFSIRDLLWLMVVIALGVAYYTERSKKYDPRDALVGEWEAVEIISEGKHQDTKRKPEWIKIDKGIISFGEKKGEFPLSCHTHHSLTHFAFEFSLNSSDFVPPAGTSARSWLCAWSLYTAGNSSLYVASMGSSSGLGM